MGKIAINVGWREEEKKASLKENKTLPLTAGMCVWVRVGVGVCVSLVTTTNMEYEKIRV